MTASALIDAAAQTHFGRAGAVDEEINHKEKMIKTQKKMYLVLSFTITAVFVI